MCHFATEWDTPVTYDGKVMSSHLYLYPPRKLSFLWGWGGGGVYCFMSIPLSIRLSVHNVLVFQYLEKVMLEFHKILQTH